MTNSEFDMGSFSKQSSAIERRPNLHEDIVAKLTEMIQEGELPPGSRIAELPLCERFGVSRTPLREALKVLAADGLVVWRANYGARVSEVNVDEVRDVFETLSGLERLIGTLLVERISDVQIKTLDAMHEELVRLHGAEDRVGYFRLNQMIHRFMASAVDNGSLYDVYEALSKKVYRARTMANYGHDRWDASVQEHEGFMSALRRRDAIELAEALEQHNAATCRAVIGALRFSQSTVDES